MPSRRRYADHGDACAAAHALDVVGDRWSVIVIRELMLGPKRFSELLACAHGATPTVLTMRLRELEQAGLVNQVALPPPALVTVYGLTEWGLEFEPILQALGRWAQRSPALPSDGGLTPDAAMLRSARWPTVRHRGSDWRSMSACTTTVRRSGSTPGTTSRGDLTS